MKHKNDAFELLRVHLSTWFYCILKFFTCNQVPLSKHRFLIYLSLLKQFLQWLFLPRQIDAWLQGILVIQVYTCKHSKLKHTLVQMYKKILISSLIPTHKLMQSQSVQWPIQLPIPLVLKLLRFSSLLRITLIAKHCKILWIQH